MTLYCKINIMVDLLREGGDKEYIHAYDEESKLSDFYYGEQWYNRLLHKYINNEDFENLKKNKTAIIKESKPGDYPRYRIEIISIPKSTATLFTTE